MDGVSWSSTRAQESFSRSEASADTLSKLASFIARADTKQQPRRLRQPPSPSPLYVCQECGKGFVCATDLLHHQEVKHTLPKPHRCPSCGQEFSLRSSLQLHQCSHDSSMCQLCHGESRPGSPCHMCTTHTSDPGRAQENSPHCQPHLMDSSPYACAPCGRGFSQKQALLHHQQAGCSEPPSPSHVLDAGSLPDDSPPISEEESSHSDSSDTSGSRDRDVSVCQYCSTTFRTGAALLRHKQHNHAEELLRARLRHKTKGERDGHQCSRRRESAKVNGSPVRRSKSKNKLLNCRSCDMVFTSTSKLRLHRKEKHRREKIIIEPRPVIVKRRRGGIYPCQVCGKVFVHHLSLRAHYRQQHAGFSFTTLKNINQSPGWTAKDSILPGNRPNIKQTSLTNNKPVRAGPGRPRKVPRTKSKVSDPGRCREVPEADVEEREFPCPSCAEVFSVQSQLWAHLELHQSAVRRRQCGVCSCEMDPCKWPGSKRHRLYHCVPCQQGFSALDSFLEHCQEHLRLRVEEDSITEGCTQQASKA